MHACGNEINIWILYTHVITTEDFNEKSFFLHFPEQLQVKNMMKYNLSDDKSHSTIL